MFIFYVLKFGTLQVKHKSCNEDHVSGIGIEFESFKML
jgi:hypothetical protein